MSSDDTVSRTELVAYLDDYLAAHEGEDLGPNGLQVEGASKISRLVTGVSACVELFEAAAERGAEAVLVHHGLFWKGQPLALTGFRYRRVAVLVQHQISLLAYHLPLDRHAEVGNNAVAARRLGVTDLVPFGDYKGSPVGWRGRLTTPRSPQDFQQSLQELYGRPPLGFTSGGPDEIRQVGIVSGGAQGEFGQAIQAGLDAYVTGEVSEWIMNMAREAGVHFFSCGHYATERLGVQALGEHLATRFGLDVEFVDVPNPV